VASLSQGRTAAAQCGLFTYKSVPVIFEPPCMFSWGCYYSRRGLWNDSRWVDWSCKCSECYFWRFFVL